MAEMRVVVQLSEKEYQTLLADVTEVFESEHDAVERDRKLRMLLQYRGYMTGGFEERWTLPETPASRPGRGRAAGAGRAKTAAKKAVEQKARGARRR